MDDLRVAIPKDASGNPIDRSMGVPVVEFEVTLGAERFVDFMNFETNNKLRDRVFHSIHIYNSSTSDLHICLGEEFDEDTDIVCPAKTVLSFDDQTFGPGIYEETHQRRVTRLRAKLSAGIGTLASGTIDYSGSGQPTDGQTVEINGTTYEFNSDSLATSGNIVVTIGADQDATWTNLANKINETDQAIYASIDTGTDTVTIESNYGGTTGNSVVIADVDTGATFSGATLTGGTGGYAPIIHVA